MKLSYSRTTQTTTAVASLDMTLPEELPLPLDAAADQPPLFDGTTRLYASYMCPYVQRVWISRNYKGLQDKIKLVPLDLKNRPAWYREKVYPVNKDSARRQFAEELISYSDKFNYIVIASFKGDPLTDAGPAFDYLENALFRWDDGPFFLGQSISLADIVYIPFVERYQIFLSEVFKYDITVGRPKLVAWMEELNKVEAYKQTKKVKPQELIERYKQRFMAQQ
uniref:In2-1 family protein n=1 Tax=Rhizophora mucronata TaxID=61149 RepID=A0A2P2JKY9_RHIMU